MSRLFYWLHEWNRRRRLNHILRHNRKHPEHPIYGEGIVPRETIETLQKYMLEHGEPL